MIFFLSATHRVEFTDKKNIISQHSLHITPTKINFFQAITSPTPSHSKTLELALIATTAYQLIAVIHSRTSISECLDFSQGQKQLLAQD
jgi:hypothetical protein